MARSYASVSPYQRSVMRERWWLTTYLGFSLRLLCLGAGLRLVIADSRIRNRIPLDARKAEQDDTGLQPTRRRVPTTDSANNIPSLVIRIYYDE